MITERRIFEILEEHEEHDKVSRIFDFALIILICINVLCIIISTFNINSATKLLFFHIEVFSVSVFTVEYFLRIYTSYFMYPDLPKNKARLKYLLSFMAIIDLLAVLPFYTSLLLPYYPIPLRIDLRILRVLRMITLLRIFKLNRYVKELSILNLVFKDKAKQLVMSTFVVFLFMLIASILIYFVENPVQPHLFKNAFSGFWWAIETLTTIGYGDMVPVTVPGKILSGIIGLLGIAFIAIPTGIISSAFITYSDELQSGIKKAVEEEIDEMEGVAEGR